MDKNIELKIDLSSFESDIEKGLEDRIPEIKNAILEMVGVIIERNVKEECPVGVSGALRNAISYEVMDNEVVIVDGMEYGYCVEYGTVPHFPPLEPLIEWARLKLQVADPEVVGRKIAWKIYHYGTEPNPFMLRGFNKSLPEIETALQVENIEMALK